MVIERAELKTIADRFIEAWQRRDAPALSRHHALDGVVEVGLQRAKPAKP
jgi:hypothetical protein